MEFASGSYLATRSRNEDPSYSSVCDLEVSIEKLVLLTTVVTNHGGQRTRETDKTNGGLHSPGGKFAQEITVIGKAVMDDGVRPGTSMEALSALKPAFSKPSSGGTTTAGNSSQLSDGAAATLVCKGKTVKELNLPMLCLWRAYAVVGVPPDIMGIGPAFAIPVAVRKAGLSLDDIDVFEINEAFAAQTVFCIKFLGLREDRVNPLGGAIALGHPLGSSGARLLVTAANFLQANNKRYAAVSLCVGTGMGAAAVIENPHYDPSTDEATSRAKL